jgi:hypothetical protein
LARELTTTFKMAAGQRLTAKAREMSKSQGDGIDNDAGAGEQAARRGHTKSASRENLYDEVAPVAPRHHPHHPSPPISSYSAEAKAVLATKYGKLLPPPVADLSSSAVAATASPPLDFSDSGVKSDGVELLPAPPPQHRMLDPPDLFNTKSSSSREKGAPR